MFRLFSVLLLLLVFNFSLFSQNSNTDTLKLSNKVLTECDTLILDSLKSYNNSVILKQDIDSINFELNIKDTNRIKVPSDTLTDISLTDTVSLQDSIIKNGSYEQLLESMRDSLFFESPDTVSYIIYNLNNMLCSDTTLNDTTKQAIDKLIDYTESRKITPVLKYLQLQLNSMPVFESADSSLKSVNDSIFRAVKYLLNNISEDSIKISFKNLNNDSIRFVTKQNEVDSIHLNLFDNRGENAVLWIKKSAPDVYKIYLEDGIYLEKTRQRKIVSQKISSNVDIPKLRKMKKIYKIIPIWKFEGSADIKFNQGHVSQSWAEGGENSISTLSVLKYSADYSYGKKRNLDTDFEYRLGYLKSGDNELQKNDDKFEFNIKYGTSAFNNWYYSGLLNFKTQFFKGKEYINDSTVNVVSEFMSPAYLVFSLGLDYKPSSKLTVLISPITSKFTIVADTSKYDQTRFGVGKDEIIRKEIGAYVKAISKLKFKDYIIVENKINFFTNYTHNPQNIDVDWETDVGIKLTDYIKMSVNAHFIYDDDVSFIDKDGKERGARPQFKELFGIGFLYNF